MILQRNCIHLYPGDIFGYDPTMTGMSRRDYTNQIAQSDIANKNKYETRQHPKSIPYKVKESK
jgi:hypothetical protein